MKEYLSRRSVPYREFDVARDGQAAAEMVRVSGQQGVPVTVIDNTVIVGFDRRRLDEALAQLSRPRLGAAVADAADMAAKGRCESREGAYIGRVSAGGVAAAAGLRVGDVIVSIAGRPVDGALSLERLVAGVRPSSAVSIVYMRGPQRLETTLRF